MAQEAPNPTPDLVTVLLPMLPEAIFTAYIIPLVQGAMEHLGGGER
jgi:hypothetical protein